MQTDMMIYSGSVMKLLFALIHSPRCLIEKEQHQLLLDEDALRETLEKAAKAEKEWEERIREEQAHDELFRLEFGVQSDSEPD
ncbi:hypothetical protein Tco_0977844 [Tanacetum coccineum]|uniref:Uncharacterized protein n=1 Tax=Tanacetum coccineum TaxID=301880 RepID=A0ABQ5EMB9_9ASTR